MPILGRRAVTRPAPLDVLIRQGAADPSVMVRRVAAAAPVDHAASLTNVKALMALVDGEKSPSVRSYIT